MRRILRHRPTPAMVIACIALTVALGGTSYAAITLPRNSVGTKQLKKNAVTAVKVKANAITSPKVRNNALTGADVNEATLATVPSATSATTATSATSATSATNAANADTLDGLDSVNVLPGGTLPAGKTLRGNWMSSGRASVPGDVSDDSIAFLYRLGAAPTAHLLAPGAPATPECPGSLSVPQAASGHLCLYTTVSLNVQTRYTCNPITNSCSSSQTNVYGTIVRIYAAAAGFYFSWGTWAVTG
jgi:hypothetical protein